MPAFGTLGILVASQALHRSECIAASEAIKLQWRLNEPLVEQLKAAFTITKPIHNK